MSSFAHFLYIWIISSAPWASNRCQGLYDPQFDSYCFKKRLFFFFTSSFESFFCGIPKTYKHIERLEGNKHTWPLGFTSWPLEGITSLTLILRTACAAQPKFEVLFLLLLHWKYGTICLFPVQERVGNFLADFYAVNGLVLESRKRREHLSEEDILRNKAIMESLSKGGSISEQNFEVRRKEFRAVASSASGEWC